MNIDLKRLLLAALTIGVMIAGATAVLAATDDSKQQSATSTSTAGTPTEDVSGNCDEAEHANDVACGGNGQAGDDHGRHHGRGADHADADGANHAEPGDDDGGAAVTPATPEPGEDVSGNCDEAEHANDVACGGTGVAPVEPGDDNGGELEPGDDHGGESGPSANSGPGSVDSGGPSESSGHGSSGSGSDDGGSDDSSGHGGGDD